MAKLNVRSTLKKKILSRSDTTQNYEGGIAFEMSPKVKLYSMVASWLVGEPKFYKELDEDGEITSQNQDPIIMQTLNQVFKEDPSFVLKLAKYARDKLYLRSAPEVLLCEYALYSKGTAKPELRKAVPYIVTRADQLANCVAYVQGKIGHIGDGVLWTDKKSSKSKNGSLPQALKEGLADCMNNFNEYKFAKYDTKGKLVSLRDVVKLVHPKPKDEAQSLLFKKILENKLAPANTWENIISNKGSTKESWEEASEVMPYMATLRNLRNLLTRGVDVKKVIEKLTDPEEVRKSKQFPFRFYSAYKQVQEFTQDLQSNSVLDAIEKALTLSISNVPRLRGSSFITSDNSGSMHSTISEKSTISNIDIANLLMAMSNKICDQSICSVFGDSHKVVNLPNSGGIISNMERASNTDVGHSTNAYLSIKHIREKKIKVDRILLFSDMQCYDSGVNRFSFMGEYSIYEELIKYKHEVNPNVYTYSFDLAGYGTLQVPENDKNTALIAGWSDKILNYIPIFEVDGRTAINEIESIKI